MELSAWFVVAMAALVFVGAVVLCWRLVALIQSTVDAGQRLSLKCIEQIQVNQARTLGKFEGYHETEVANLRGQMERVLEFALSDENQRPAIARQHTLERHEALVTQATHSTNDRRADIMEAAALKERETVQPEEKPAATRQPVPRSRESLNRAAIADGAIPQRHA